MVPENIHTCARKVTGNSIFISWFSCGSPVLIESEFGNNGFSEGSKTGVLECLENDKNQQQSQATYVNRPELNQDHIGGRQELSH